MRLLRRTAALALLLLAAAAPAFADIALPKPAQEPRSDGEIRRDLPYSRMSIERVEGLREARLQIPRAQLERLSAAAGLEGGAQSGFINSAGTVVGGLFLSLGVLLTGLMLLRSRRGLRAGRAAAAALVVCVSVAGLAAVAAYANAGPPPGYMPMNPGTLGKAVSGAPLSGSIRVEIVEGGGEIKLLVPARSSRGGEE